MLDEEAHLGGQTPPGGAGRQRSVPFARRVSVNGEPCISEFAGKQPGRPLSDFQVFEDTPPHLLNIAVPERSSGKDALFAGSRSEGPGPYGSTLDQDDGFEAIEILHSNEHLHRVEFVQVRLLFRLSESPRQGSFPVVAHGPVYLLAVSPTDRNGL